MERAKEVVFRQTALDSILSIAKYIRDRGSPMNAGVFEKKLYDFGLTLGLVPGKHPLCRDLKLRKKNLHCAVFRKHYLFAYKSEGEKVIIYNVIHAATLE